MAEMSDAMRRAARDLTERERFPKSSWVAVAVGMQHERVSIIELLEQRIQRLIDSPKSGGWDREISGYQIEALQDVLQMIRDGKHA